MSRAIDDLDVLFKPLAIELVARCVESGIMVCIVDTRRSEAEHQLNLARGVSWIPRSKHIDGLAIDICPFERWNIDGPDKLRWAAHDPVWQKIGEIGEKLGLRWGGRWGKDGGKAKPDLSHFEFVERRTNNRESER